jgi:hypothetical protein
MAAVTLTFGIRTRNIYQIIVPVLLSIHTSFYEDLMTLDFSMIF